MSLARCRWAFALALGVVCGLPRLALASAHRYELTWTAPAECPSEQEIRARVERLLLGSQGGAAPLPMGASARVETTPEGRFVAEVEIRSDAARSSRQLRASSCSTIASAYALMVATLIDPAVVEPDEEAPEPLAPAPSNASARVEPRVTPRKPETSSQLQRSRAEKGRAAYSLAALGWGASHLLPNLAAGVGLGAGVRAAPLALELELQYFLPQRRASAPRATAGAHFERAAALARACLVIGVHPTVWDTCAGLETALLRGTGYGVTEPLVGTQTFWGLSWGLGARFRLRSRLALRLAAELSVPLARPYFGIEGLGRVYQLSAIGGRLGIGPELWF
jgi:hypothetical protein